MPFRVGVTSGLYYVARADELATMVRKLGYALTRGTSAIEVAGDVPHEITQTEGKEMRYIIHKQGIDLLLHGSLTIPMCIPERSDWRDAHDHMQKSIRSAVFAGCKYVDFHACLNIWLELMTYAGRKLTMVFCDQEGNFISKIMKEDSKLRKWYVEKKWEDYQLDILTRDELYRASSRGDAEADTWRREELGRRLREAGVRDIVVDYYTSHDSIPPIATDEEVRKIREIAEKLLREFSVKRATLERKYIKDAIEDKLAKGGKWRTEELRAIVGIVDGYHIMAHHMFFTKDKMWTEMAKLYKDLLEDYKLDYDNFYWLDEAWERAERENDREFKLFFYGVVGAKYLEGHIKKILEWMEDEKKGLIKEINDMKIPEEEKEELKEYAKKLILAIESPDARDPTHAGLHLLWAPKQIYAAIKVIREELDTDRVWMLADFEHVATQGIDPIKDMEKIIETCPDFGKITISCHANAPNPAHSHIPLELGDIRIYKLLYYLWKTGFGKDKTVYVIFERGGGDDPFKQSVETLKLCVKFLELGIHPDKLPLEFFGVKGLMAGDIERQRQIMRDKAYEPLKDLLEMPEEEWGLFSQAAVKKGKGKEWEKEKWR